MTKKRERQPPTPSPPAAVIQDTVERIVNAAENRDAATRESSLVNGSTQQPVLEATHYGGPLTSKELSQLALLCSSAASAVVNNGALQQQQQWASVDGDLMASLTPMLRAHVHSAMRVDLVGEGLGVISNTIKAESSPEKKSGPVITIHQVREISLKLALF